MEKVSNALWAGTSGGLYISGDAGDSWQLTAYVPVTDVVSRIIVQGDTVLLLVAQYNSFNGDYSINLFRRTAPGDDWETHTTPAFDWSGRVDNFFLNSHGLFIHAGVNFLPLWI